MSDKPEFPPLPPGPGMISIDLLERLGLKDRLKGPYAYLAGHGAEIIAAIEEAEKKASEGRLTLRELLQKLQALDEKYLDGPIYVRHPNGGYSSIKDASILHPDTEVSIIHLLNSRSSPGRGEQNH